MREHLGPAGLTRIEAALVAPRMRLHDRGAAASPWPGRLGLFHFFHTSRAKPDEHQIPKNILLAFGYPLAPPANIERVDRPADILAHFNPIFFLRQFRHLAFSGPSVTSFEDDANLARWSNGNNEAKVSIWLGPVA